MAVRPGSLTPTIDDRHIPIVLDGKNTKGASFAGNALAYFSGVHTNFADFLENLAGIVDCMSEAKLPFHATTVALRYVNVFEIAAGELMPGGAISILPVYELDKPTRKSNRIPRFCRRIPLLHATYILGKSETVLC